MNCKNRRAFTLIELIVVMAVIGILVLLATPKFMNYTKEAKITKMIATATEIEKASERYYMNEIDWPRLEDEYYTAEEVEAFAQKIYDNTGVIITLDPNGKYYDIDYEKLSKYINVPDSKDNYIIQNPIGDVFYLDGLTEQGLDRKTIELPIEPEVPELPDLINVTMLDLEFKGKTNNSPDKTSIKDKGPIGTVVQLNNFNYTSTSGWATDGLIFDGINDYLLIPTSANNYVKPTNQLSVSITAYRDNWSTDKNERFIGSQHSGGWAMGINRTASNYLFFSLMLSGDTDYTIISVPVSQISDGLHTFTGTFDGRYIKLYVDGVLKVTKDLGTIKTIKYTYNNAVIVGAEAGSGTLPEFDWYHKLKLINLSIYNRGLTESEIEALSFHRNGQ